MDIARIIKAELSSLPAQSKLMPFGYKTNICIVALIALGCSPLVYAQAVQKPESQRCSDDVLRDIGKHFNFDGLTYRNEQGKGLVLMTACRICPYDESITLSAFLISSYHAGGNPELLIGMVDNKKNQLLARYGENAIDLPDSELPAEEINILQLSPDNKAQHYGWPYCYNDGDKVVSFAEFKTGKEECENAVFIPAYRSLPGHSAPLGMIYPSSKKTAGAGKYAINRSAWLCGLRA